MTRCLACLALLIASAAPAADWPQWCGSHGKNMVSAEKGLPDTFLPGKKRADRVIDLSTAKNVRWGVKICDALYSTPSVAEGKVFIGGVESGDGILACLDETTGKLLWKWSAAPRQVPKTIAGFRIGVSINPPLLGVCSSAAVDHGRVYFVSNRFDAVCLDARGQPAGPEAGKPRVLWSFDMWDKLGVFPCDAANGSPVLDGDLLYVQTCNGVDRNSAQAAMEKRRKIPAPKAPNLIVLDKRTGRLAATDDTRIAEHMMHGQWSSPSLGTAGGRKLVFYGGGDGRCYAFEAISAVPDSPVRLTTVWSCDCVPPEYKASDGLDPVTRYCLGDRRVRDTWNKNDGQFVGVSEIVATPVYLDNRVYVAIGRDPEHGRGRGALHCIDAAGIGDITKSGRIWTYQGLDRTLSTVSVADGLVYVGDVGGRLHCLDQRTGKCYWVFKSRCEVWGSTLAADGKIYLPTAKGLWVLAAGKLLKVLGRVQVGGRILASPVAANGTLYVAATNGWLWAVRTP
jgi:outer membrane protein assembly factor BamB